MPLKSISQFQGCSTSSMHQIDLSKLFLSDSIVYKKKKTLMKQLHKNWKNEYERTMNAIP